MRTIIIMGIIFMVATYWHDLSLFVTGNARIVDKQITEWLIKNTPHK